jgi:hypothetical protein
MTQVRVCHPTEEFLFLKGIMYRFTVRLASSQAAALKHICRICVKTLLQKGAVTSNTKANIVYISKARNNLVFKTEREPFMPVPKRHVMDNARLGHEFVKRFSN